MNTFIHVAPYLLLSLMMLLFTWFRRMPCNSKDLSHVISSIKFLLHLIKRSRRENWQSSKHEPPCGQTITNDSLPLHLSTLKALSVLPPCLVHRLDITVLSNRAVMVWRQREMGMPHIFFPVWYSSWALRCQVNCFVPFYVLGFVVKTACILDNVP